MDGDALSPSLLPREQTRGDAYELKFLLDPAAADRVLARVAGFMRTDPHGDPALGGGYRTTTLYLDTPNLDVFHRTPSFKRRKYRVRRYGLTSWVYLERKTKIGERVRKRRAALPEVDLPRMAAADSPEDWPGHWFHHRARFKGLGPAARVWYTRSAWVGQCAEGPLRLTIDRDIAGVPASEWRLAPAEAGKLLLPGQVILELKFQGALPRPFKDLVFDFTLSPAAVSKYRLCRAAWAAMAGIGTGAARA
jgi:hypothetical protein